MCNKTNGSKLNVRGIAITDKEEKKDTIKEARILEALKHPNIIRFREVYKTRKGKLCIVMDFADGGDICKKIKDANNKFFSEEQILDWFT